MGKKFACASDWLVLLLVMVAAVVLVGLLAGRNMWREINVQQDLALLAAETDKKRNDYYAMGKQKENKKR